MRYAKAIIEYAQEKGLEDRLYQEFLTLSHSFYHFGTAKQA